MAKLTELVGHAVCAECGFGRAEVFRNKRGKLALKCPKVEGCNCTYTNQSFEAQELLKKRTKFISENHAPIAPPPENTGGDPVPESEQGKIPESAPPDPENVPPKRKPFSLLKRG